MDLRQVALDCKEISITAGNAIMEIYSQGFDVEYKADESPLTSADKAANQIIVTALQSRYPGRMILSEESADDLRRLKEAYCFIVDPLDGTKEFISRNGQFTVNIALACQGKIVAGAVYVPVAGELFYAWQDGGSYRQTKDAGEERIHVSDKLTDLIFVGSKSHSGDKERALLETVEEKVADLISVGSSLKGCMVACGKADIYYRYGLTCEWDTAAMQCIVEEAGGIVLQMDGTELTYNRKNTLNEKGFLMVNRKENIWI